MRAQLGIGTIGIAIIVLVLVVVVIGIFTNFFGGWTGGKGIGGITDRTCSEAGGTEKTECDTVLEKQAFGFFKDLGAGQKCCVDKACTDFPNHHCGGSGFVESCLTCPGGESCLADEDTVC